MAGLLGVGGGTVMVPLLVLLGGLGQRAAHAVSLGAIIPIAVAGTAVYAAAGKIDWVLALALTVGAVAGAQIGVGMLARLSERRLKLVFGGFLVMVAAAMVIGA